MASPPHFLLFPFMAKGHTIPLLHLARLLLRRGISVTIITTPTNSPFIRHYLTNTNASILQLPFPQNILPDIPTGTESTDKLPSMSLHLPFAKATRLMQPDFDHTLQTLPRLSCIVSDAFLFWTQQSASNFDIPLFFFYGMSNFAMTIYRILAVYRPHASVDSDDELFSLPVFPRVKLTKNDLEPPFDDPDPNDPQVAFVIEQVVASFQTKGYIVNSFDELEPQFVEYWNRECQPKAWCVGPLCLLAEPPKAQPRQKPKWIQWLDENLTLGRSVLYVAFGSQAEISGEQYREIATGLERSKVSFLWVVRSNSKGVEEMLDAAAGFEDRGLIVRDWVDQVEILSHESVNGFMSHCGWNSALESICASVPILAWPMMAEQHLNARMVVDELGVGLRVFARNGSVRGFVGSECIEKMSRELMEGEKGKEVRKKVKEFGELGRKALEVDGSSKCTLDLLIDQVSQH